MSDQAGGTDADSGSQDALDELRARLRSSDTLLREVRAECAAADATRTDTGAGTDDTGSPGTANVTPNRGVHDTGTDASGALNGGLDPSDAAAQSPQLDTGECEAFARLWSAATGSGHITLTVIPAAGGATTTMTFKADAMSAMAKWIRRQQDQRKNVYFEVNETHPDCQKKPTKGQMIAALCRHADVDPVDDQFPYAEERNRLHRLAKHLHDDPVMPPTVVLDSGNGIYPLWVVARQLLTQPITETVEAENQTIEAAVGASGTFNIDRLLRLPGTLNYPNAKKLKLGRGVTRARVLDHSNRTYTADQAVGLGAHLHRLLTSSDLVRRHVEPVAQGKPKGGSKPGTKRTGVDRSAAALRIGAAIRRAGGSYEDMVARLRADPETADWCREKGEANSQRELHRIWDKAAGDYAKILAATEAAAKTAPETIVDVLIKEALKAGFLSEIERFWLCQNASKLSAVNNGTRDLVPAIKKQLNKAIRERDKHRDRQRRGDNDKDWLGRALCIEDGKPFGNLANAALALREALSLRDLIRYDEMLREPVLMRAAPGRPSGGRFPRPIGDEDVAAIQEWIQNAGLPTLTKDVTHQAIDLVARERSFHPVKEELEGVKHDGIWRIDTWLQTYLGADDSEYTTAIGKMFLISMIARIYQPGVKADYTWVMEGHQGTLKSTALRILGGRWYTDSLPDIRHKDASQHLNGKWLIEIGELAALGKSNAHKKAFLTRQEEQYRRPYGRRDVREERQCVFVCTVNDANYLDDETGARRFWPMLVGTINIEALTRDRDQLLAEALVLYRRGERWWPDADFEMTHIKPQQDARFDEDVWTGAVLEFLKNVDQSTVLQIAKGALDLTPKEIKRPDQDRIKRVLTRVGWEKGLRTREGRWWYSPAKKEELIKAGAWRTPQAPGTNGAKEAPAGQTGEAGDDAGQRRAAASEEGGASAALSAFVRDRCVVHEFRGVQIARLHDAYVYWCREHDHAPPMCREFVLAVQAIIPDVTTVESADDNGELICYFQGVDLVTDQERVTH